MAAAPDPADPALDVADLLARVQTALHAELPGPVWIRGEVASFKDGTHPRFSLTGDDPDRPGSRVSVACVMFAPVARRVLAKLQATGVQLGDGTAIRLRGRVEVWASAGQLQVKVDDIDPSFTLGARELERRRLLDALEREDLVGAQRRLPRPGVVRRIGLVAAPGSKGSEDFLDTLRRADAPCRVVIAPATVQGPDCAASVADAIARLVAHHRGGARLDAIAVVRGGGARDDLSGFDAEAVARAIATCGVPVRTGLGHTGDATVADLVAQDAATTPTDCAQRLVAGIIEARATVERTTERIRSAAHQRLEFADRALRRGAGRVNSSVRRAAQLSQHTIDTTASRVTRASRARLKTAAQHHELAARTAQRAGRAALSGAADRLGVASARTAASIRARRDELGRRLDAIARTHRALDPQRVLERGWAAVLRSDGTPLRAKSARPGEALSIRLADGEVGAHVNGPRTTRRRRPSVATDEPALFDPEDQQ